MTIDEIKKIAESTPHTVADIASSVAHAKQFNLPLDLQFFAAGGSDDQDNNPDDAKGEQQGDQSDDENEKDVKSKDDEPKFTQTELEEIVKQRLARAEKQKLEAIKEAEKLAKMNEQEKQQYEFEKTQRELEEMKKQLNRYELGKEATRILAEKGIVANDTILDLVVRDNAEQTNESVTAFVELLTDLVDQQVKEKLKGNAPRKQTGVTGITKQDILNIKDSAERIRAIQENQHLFK